MHFVDPVLDGQNGLRYGGQYERKCFCETSDDLTAEAEASETEKNNNCIKLIQHQMGFDSLFT